jgi:asparagine synthase (glutamine-hydrolysing)
MSDRADVLAGLGQFSLDERTLATWLLRVAPHPLLEQPLWRGVRPVPPGSYVLVGNRSDQVDVRDWWNRPAPELTRSQGAVRFYNALENAVRARATAGEIIHSDLSGGMDSTPLTYLAARTDADVVATTAFIDDPGGMEDLRWARMALPAMPNVVHVVESLADAPPFFGGMPELNEPLDMPTQAHIAAPRIGHSIRLAMRHKASMYINGLGGDQVLRGLPVWDHTLFRERPLLALRRLRVACMLNSTGSAAVIRRLVDNRSYEKWFQDALGDVRTGAQPRTETVSLAWGSPIVLPEWLTAEARDSVLTRLEELCAGAEPLGDNRAAHAELFAVQDAAAVVRCAQQFAATIELPFESPFLDDRVVEACFAVRREERHSPTTFKPLMKDAMRNALPDSFLRRSTKIGGQTQAARGLHAHWEEIVETCESSPLATSGLVDIDKFRLAASLSHPLAHDPAIQQTINTAVFMRNQNRRAAAAR